MLSIGIAVKANGAASATTAAQTTTPGSGIQVLVSCTVAPGSPPTVTDSKGNALLLVGSGVQVSSNPGSVFIYKDEGGSRGSGHTWSVTANDVTLMVVEILGTNPVVDTSSAGNTDTTSPYESGSITPSVADFALVGTVAAGGLITSWTAGASFTKQLEETNDGLYWPAALGTRLVTGGSGSYLTSWTTGTGGTTFGLHVVAWKESGASPTREQEGARFRNDDGSEAAATWAAAQDSNITAPLATNLRLRALVNATLDPATAAYTLRYQKNGAGGYVAVPVGASVPEAYSQPTWGAAGTAGSGTTSCTPAYPTGISSATSKLFCMVTGRSNTADTVPTMPAGWTRIGGLEGGTGTWGVDLGTRRVDFFQKDTVTGSESGTVTVSLAGTTANTLRATIFRVGVASGYGIDVEFVSGADASNDTSYSAAATTNATFDSNRLVLIGTAQNVDTGTASSRAISATGVTFGTLTNRADTAVTNGNDHRHILNSVPVSSGSGTVAPTFSYTISASGSGPTAFLVLRGRLPAVTNEIYIAPSANIAAGGEATTAQLTAPSGKSTSDFVAGRLWDDENGSDSIDITADDYTEVEWCLQAQSPAVNGDYFDFRVYAGASALDTYTVTPRWTLGAGGPAPASPPPHLMPSAARRCQALMFF